jgi:hypothetical protein
VLRHPSLQSRWLACAWALLTPGSRGPRGIRGSFSSGDYVDNDERYDELQVVGIQKYMDLFAETEMHWRWKQRYNSVSFGKECVPKSLGSRCDNYPKMMCSFRKYMVPKSRQIDQTGEHRCVERFGPSTYKIPYNGAWYEEDNWYLEPRIVGEPKFRAKIVAKFKELKILDDSFDTLPETEQKKLLTAALEKRYGE